MARRRSESGTDSLDLLLDTICNVFGGIILLAILVILQTQVTAASIPKPEPTDIDRVLEIRRLKMETLRLEDELADRKTRMLTQEDRYQRVASPAKRKLLGRKRELLAALAGARTKLGELTRNTAQARKSLAAQEQRLTQVDEALKRGDRELAEKRRALAKAKARARSDARKLPRGIRLPHRRGLARGAARYFIIKGNRAYVLERIRWGTGRSVSGQCIVESEGGAVSRKARVSPQPGSGYPIPQKSKRGDAIDRQVKQYRPSGSYFVFFVWNDNDSFLSFQRLKKVVLDAGFQYAAHACQPEGNAIILVPSRGHESE